MTGTIESALYHCLICRQTSLQLIAGYSDFRRVTSDCRVWTTGGRLGFCPHCGNVQTPVDDCWRAETAEVYREYSHNHQINRRERRMIDSQNGKTRTRSDVLLDLLVEHFSLHSKGRFLDIGCGNGNLLSAFHNLKPDWELWGVELDDRHKTEIEAIPGLTGFFTGDPGDIPGRFNLISLVHTLEHLDDPRGLLRSLLGKLSPDGLLLVNVPDFRLNPFDLLIVDHCIHYTPDSIRYLFEKNGWVVEHITGSFLSREIILFAHPGEQNGGIVLGDPVQIILKSDLEWLRRIREIALNIFRKSGGGILGTSIAATWLAGELEAEKLLFFVDEDPSRAGRLFMGKPVYLPVDAPEGCPVILPLPRPAAEQVKNRLSDTKIEIVLPPAMV